jgi:hypothetical protein
MFLYKYRSLDEKSKQNTLDIIKYQKLFFSSPSEFNDPFECRPHFSFEASESEVEEYCDYLCSRMIPNLSEIQRKEKVAILVRNCKDNPLAAAKYMAMAMQKEMETCGVLCLAERPSNLLMWAHYADNHRGICLGFNASDTNPFFGRALKVTYSQTYPTVNLFRDSRDSYHETITLTKSDHWEYEQEWRIIKHEQGRDSQLFSPSDLKEVIFGLDTKQRDIDDIINLLSETQQQPKLFQAKRHDKKYKLVPTPIDA